jgi:carboxypeptidase C (cathepsin A)
MPPVLQTRKSGLAALLIAASVSSAPLIAQAQTVLMPVSTPHSLTLGKTQLKYTATFTEKMLTNAAGEPVATLSAISYVRDGVKDVSQRPVVFMFNGGPGASSSPLHMSAFGPRVRRDARDGSKTQSLSDNPDTLLDAADLVFIDPVGTGLSRVFKADEMAGWLGVNHDASAVFGVITDWLKANGRQSSPVFIAGESYGGTRAAVIAGQIVDTKSDINLKGLILISPALDYSVSADMSHILEFPSLAAGAWFHQKIDRKGRTLEAFVGDAKIFAADVYAPALIKGPHLSEAEREQVAEGMAGFIGLPASAIKAADLRPESELYLGTLNADKNLTTGRLDMRVTAPKAPPANPDRPAAANDPSLGLGRSNVIKSPLITGYLRDELKVPVSEDYVSLSLELNFKWNWADTNKNNRFALNTAPDLTRIMKARPELKMMVVGGYYDLATPVWEARYTLEHASLPLERVSFNTYATGHSVYNPDDDLKSRADQIRAFIAPKK